MLKNKYLSKFREEDKVCVDARKSGKCSTKRYHGVQTCRKKSSLTGIQKQNLKKTE